MNFIKENKKMILFGLLGLLIMGGICFLLYEPLMNFIKDPSIVKKELSNYGLMGGFILSLIMALQVIFVFLPGELIEVLAGFIYGPIVGMILCLIGAGIGSFVIYLLIKRWGSPLIDKLIGKNKLKEVSFLKDEGRLKMLLFIIFLIPGTPKDIITYFIPLTDMKFSTFLMITTVARIPSVISSTIGGNALGLEEYKLTFIVFAITTFFTLIGLYIYKNKIHRIQTQDNL